MTVRRLLIGAMLVVVGAPVLCVVAILAAVHFANRSNGAIVVNGERREYLLYVPRSYDPAKAAPLVISLHPAASWPAMEMKLSRWNEAADAHGFIVVYPAGRGTGPKTWFMSGSATPARMPDIVFIAALIDSLEAHYDIDPARIYANGMSNGAGMAFALSCTLADRIAAVGAVSAAQSLSFNWCPDSTAPVPMIEFHGTADPFVPYTGAGTSWLNPEPFPNVRQWVARWARRNRCDPRPADAMVADDVARLSYARCAGDAAVVLYTVRGAGHQWYGGRPLPAWLVGPTSTSVDATALMWDFFVHHPLRRHAAVSSP